ncbi:3-dehydroquinate synthase [Kitasatospora herbaricolor]|uniref:sedoheptulose 7-phosphate cyclase n=1 Tax=Kitasatospora herbaricolor TaxID=68217 RepID=UPI00199DEC43|nr:sedoheptulose 7-phosphate cyclase [Kitasatospora herbaricolor]MDQ0306334.1 3-dehydroquinate synthase [Kitasatospora herbaricolor]GGV40425.1 3-dehydroquinate synthase [Kitasatospora herbaricolor]
MNSAAQSREPLRWTITTQLPVAYEIVETPGLLDPANPELLSLPGGATGTETRLVVLDHSVSDLYGERIRAYFDANDVPVTYLSMPGDEESKSIGNVLDVVAKLNEVGTNRLSNPPIVIGGGVLADVVGLAASLYRRGIPYIRVPTTLLGQVDVSVAAKTGINFGGYRNRLGSYSPPPRTLIDREFLATVPRRQIRNGMGEIFKMALIKDLRLFELLEEHGADLIEARFQASDGGPLPAGVPDEVIGRAIAGMAEELQPNLWEKDLRRSVDYGHSFSPLVEMRALPELLHGEAVAMDCVFSAVLAAQRGLIDEAVLERIIAAAVRLGLSPSHPLFCDVDLLTEALADTVRHRDGKQHLPVLTRIGEVCFLDDLSVPEIASAADRMGRLLGPAAVPVAAGRLG